MEITGIIDNKISEQDGKISDLSKDNEIFGSLDEANKKLEILGEPAILYDNGINPIRSSKEAKDNEME